MTFRGFCAAAAVTLLANPLDAAGARHSDGVARSAGPNHLHLAAADGGPSFDCARAASFDEHAICASSVLSRMDVALNEAYREAIDRAAPDVAENLRRAQRAWLASRRDCLADFDCISNQMARRIAELQSDEQVDAPGDAPRSASPDPLPLETADAAPASEPASGPGDPVPDQALPPGMVPFTSTDGILRQDGRMLVISGGSRGLALDVSAQQYAVGQALAFAAIAADPEGALTPDYAALYALNLLEPEEQDAFLAEAYPDASDTLRDAQRTRPGLGSYLTSSSFLSDPFRRKEIADAAKARLTAIARARGDDVRVRILCRDAMDEYDPERGIIPLTGSRGGVGCTSYSGGRTGVDMRPVANFHAFPAFIEVPQDKAEEIYAELSEWPPFLAFDADVSFEWHRGAQDRPYVEIRFDGGPPYWLADAHDPRKVLYFAEPPPEDLVDFRDPEDILQLFERAAPADPATSEPQPLFGASGRIGLGVTLQYANSVGDPPRLAPLDGHQLRETDALAAAIGVPHTHLIDVAPAIPPEGIARVVLALPAPADAYLADVPDGMRADGSIFTRMEFELHEAWRLDGWSGDAEPPGGSTTQATTDSSAIVIASARPIAAAVINNRGHRMAHLELDEPAADPMVIFPAVAEAPPEPVRDYGNADIIGLTIGMETSAAEHIIRDAMDVGWTETRDSTELSAPDPLDDYRLFISADGLHRVTLFWHPADRSQIVGIARVVAMPAPADMSGLRNALIKKYGTPRFEFEHAGTHLVWTEHPGVHYNAWDDPGATEPDHFGASTCNAHVVWRKPSVSLVPEDDEFADDARIHRLLPIGPYMKFGDWAESDFARMAASGRCGPVIHAELREWADHVILSYGIVDSQAYHTLEPQVEQTEAQLPDL